MNSGQVYSRSGVDVMGGLVMDVLVGKGNSYKLDVLDLSFRVYVKSWMFWYVFVIL